ncbi:hypothetical protein CRYUN_Cryun10bG0116600 [Craigia yunnanensis]
MKRDFTWVQSIAILFDKHQLFLGALKTSTWDDSIDRLILTFDGQTLSDEVNGVLGQTYKPGYVSHVDIGAKMPVMGGNIDFHSSSLFVPDCAVSRFSGINKYDSLKSWEMPGLRCASGIEGRGVVCKR